MKKTIRNHIDTITTCRLAEGLILERRVTENGIDLRVMLQRPLEEYDSQVDIQNAYGYEMITETEYARLMELWELRAQSVQKAGPYKDRVVEMLELAARAIWDAYGENVAAYDEKVSRMHREARRIAQENLLRDLDSKNI